MDKRAKHSQNQCFESRNIQLRKPLNNSSKSKLYFYCIFVYFVLTILIFTALLLDNLFTHQTMPVKAVDGINCVVLDLNLDDSKQSIVDSNLENITLVYQISTRVKEEVMTRCDNSSVDYYWTNTGYVFYYAITSSTNWGKAQINLESTKTCVEVFNSDKRRFLQFDIILPNEQENITEFKCSTIGSTDIFFDNTNSISYIGILVKAIWEDASLITLQSDGGVGGDSVLYAFSGEMPSVDSIEVPTKQGYTFLGYYDGDLKYVNADGTLVKDDVLYETLPTSLTAKWEADSLSYTISLINGNESFGELEVINGIVQNDSINPPLKNGYEFLGFFDENGVKYIDGSGNIDKSTQLYASQINNLFAQYQIETYSITYLNIDGTPLSNNNVNNPDSFTIESDTFTLDEPTAPSGYHFVGWSTDKENIVKDFTISKGTFENITVYAHFEMDLVSVTFNCNNYTNQTFMIFVYLNDEICYQYVVSSSKVVISLEKVDYSSNKYTFRFVSGYMTMLTLSSYDNITKLSNNLLELNTLTSTEINYFISTLSFNSFVV